MGTLTDIDETASFGGNHGRAEPWGHWQEFRPSQAMDGSRTATSRKALWDRSSLPCQHTEECQEIDSEIGCTGLKLFFDQAFSVIEILAIKLIQSHELARADRFSDKVRDSDLRRVKNFSTSQSRHD